MREIRTRQAVVRANLSEKWRGMEPGHWVVSASVITPSLNDMRDSQVATVAFKQGSSWVGLGTCNIFEKTPFCGADGRSHFASLKDLMQAALDLALHRYAALHR